jgi:hypothetical protein
MFFAIPFGIPCHISLFQDHPVIVHADIAARDSISPFPLFLPCLEVTSAEVVF